MDVTFCAKLISYPIIDSYLMMIKNLLSFLFLGMSTFLFGQDLLISGLVKDGTNQEALIGVSIYSSEREIGTITDDSGKFELRLELGDRVQFSYLGYDPKELTIEASTFLEIELFPSNATLDEIVVTALGLKRETAELGYALQKIEGRNISGIKSPNFVQNLAGKVAGVQITQGATGIGSSSKITIRGEASFTNNNPLFVVDGMPINNNSTLNISNEAAAGFQEVDFGNGAMGISADDVASVSVLKGPSAAALYGTRAANGVIIITTKDGDNSKGLGISFSATNSFERPFQLPQFQNDYGQGNSGEFAFVDGLGGGTNDNITYSWGPRTDAGILLSQFDSPVILANGNTVRGGDVSVHGGGAISQSPFISHPNNLKDFYRTGLTSNNHLSISSGFEKGNFRLSLADFRNESIIPGTDLKRKTVNTRLNFAPTERIRINSSFQYTQSKSDNRPAGGYGSENVNYSLVAWGPRSLDTEILKDYWQPGLEGLQQYSFNYTFFDNPYFILQENRNAFKRDRLFGQINAAYQLTDGLRISLRTGLDLSNEQRTFRRNYSTNRFKTGAYAEHFVSYLESNTDVLVQYKKRFGNWGMEWSAGGNRLDQFAETNQLQTVSLAQAGIFSLSNAAAPIQSFGFKSHKRINSLYGLSKASYKDFLFLDLSGRNDWSSALATSSSTSNVSFFYPSISSSFVLSNLFELPQNISFLKLRGSWASVGNDTDPYQTSSAFQAQTSVNGQATFSAQDLIANGDLLPEKTNAYEVGGDIRFWEYRLSLGLTYYNALTKNQIIALPVPISSGFTQKVVNGGKVRSSGIEILAGIKAIRKKEFSWDILFNFSKNKAVVEELPSRVERLTLAYSRVYDNTNQTIWFQVSEGGKIGDMYGTGYLKNENGDFIIDEEGRYIVDNTLRLLGNYNPDFTLGMTQGFSYKNWSVHALLDWRQGGTIVSRTLSLAGVAGQLEETKDRPEEGIVAKGVFNSGTTDSPNWIPNTASVSAEQYYRQYYDRNHEENNTYNASYLKLRELSIGYVFENLGRTDQDGLSLEIALIGRNLFAISEIPHFDPEQMAVQGQSFINGVEDMSYASSRSIGIKLDLAF